jgi:hypothetical protein
MDSPPPRFHYSPDLFSQILKIVLEEFALSPGISLLQCVDELLLSRLTEKEVTAVTVNLVDFLVHQGLRVSKTKLKFVEEEVRYLGHLISKGKCRLSHERIEGITSMPLSLRGNLKKFLGLIRYCRLWIESYALKNQNIILQTARRGA